MPVLPGDFPEGYPLPPTPDAPRICVQLEIPNEPTHIANFIGALLSLTIWKNYRAEADRRNKPVADVWRDIVYGIQFGNCTIPAIPGSAGAEAEDNLIRQNPDNPCLLETSIDGVNWCQFADLSLCFGAPQQPGQGSQQPPAGGCASYHAVMPGNGQWLLPTIVSSGDTIEVLGPTGVTYDGGNLDWHCPDGDVFFAGFCTGVSFTHVGNPIPTAPEMRLIANIGGTFYDVLGSAFTVPVGVSNAQVSFQVNHSDLTGDGGSLTFDVKVCNNQSSTWTHTFNFLANDGAFLNIPYPSGNPTAAWTAAVGWEANNCVVITSTSVYTLLGIYRDFATATITGFSMTYDAVLGANPAGDTTRVSLRTAVGDNFIINEAPRAGTNLTDSWTGSIAGVQTLLIFPIFAFANAAGSCDPTPAITLKSITISGTGPDPF